MHKRRGRGEGQERVGVVQESSHRAAAAESKRERGLVPRAAERGAPALVAPALPLDPAGAGEVEIWCDRLLDQFDAGRARPQRAAEPSEARYNVALDDVRD